ncbi:MarR family transcriptional regulator [Microbacterium aurum]
MDGSIPVSSPVVDQIVEAVLAFRLGKRTKHVVIAGGFGAGKSYALSRAAEVARKGALRVAVLERGPLGMSSYADFLVEVAKATQPAVLTRAEADGWRFELLKKSGDLDERLRATRVSEKKRKEAVAELVSRELREIERRVIDGSPGLVVVFESIDQLLHQLRATDRPWLIDLLTKAQPNLLILGSVHGTGLADELGERIEFLQAAYLPTIEAGAALALQEARRLGADRPKVSDRLARSASALDPTVKSNWLFWALVGRYLVVARREPLHWAEQDLRSRAASHFDAMLLTLAPSEQRILLALAEAGGPRTVGELADTIGVRNQAAATALGRLLTDDWVRVVEMPSEPDRRRTWYDIADPMLRLHLLPAQQSE